MFPPLLARAGRPADFARSAQVNLHSFAAGLLLLGYVALLVTFSPLSLQDYPNHLARALVLADLVFRQGAHFGTLFQYHFLPTPYILGDLLLACAIECFGMQSAAALWSVVAFLSLPCALLWYLRTTTLSNDGKLLLFAASLYLSIDWFFLMGFLEFRLGVAVTLMVLAQAEYFRKHRSPLSWIGYVCLLSLGYATHLSTLLFSAILIGGTALFRLYGGKTRRLSTELWLVLPCGILLAFYFGIAVGYRQSDDLVENPYLWGPLWPKLDNLSGEFYRYGTRTDSALLLLFALCIVLYVDRVRNWRADAVAEHLMRAGLMLILYAALPRGYSEAYFVDVRALPLLTLFAVVALICAESPSSPQRAGRPALGVALALLLATLNLVYLGKHFAAHGRWLRDYRAVVARIPEGARVLPIYTQITDGHIFPFRHAFAFALIDRGARVPYLQTGDTGNPEKYIRYLQRPYAPTENWYNEPQSPAVDWRRIACEYDFILATEPFDAKRLGGLETKLVTKNASAALFALPPGNALTLGASQVRTGAADSSRSPCRRAPALLARP
jgi:hypothetical protein